MSMVSSHPQWFHLCMTHSTKSMTCWGKQRHHWDDSSRPSFVLLKTSRKGPGKRGGADWKKSKYNFVIDSCMTTIHIVGGTLDKCISFRQKIDQVNESMEAYIIQWQSETIAEVSLSRNPFKLFHAVWCWHSHTCYRYNRTEGFHRHHWYRYLLQVLVMEWTILFYQVIHFIQLNCSFVLKAYYAIFSGR